MWFWRKGRMVREGKGEQKEGRERHDAEDPTSVTGRLFRSLQVSECKLPNMFSSWLSFVLLMIRNQRNPLRFFLKKLFVKYFFWYTICKKK